MMIIVQKERGLANIHGEILIIGGNFKMNIEELDSNWVTPAGLASELNIARSTVSSWIYRKQITFCVIQGANKRRYLVDRRTVPILKTVGRPCK